MAPSVTLDRRPAIWATLLFVVFAYEAERLAAVFTGHLAWIPQVTAAPLWARVGFHAALAAPAVALCAFWAFRAIASMRLHITPHLTAVSARQTVVGSRLARWLPPTPSGAYTLRLNRLDDWRWWGLGAGMFLVTALPYWGLLWLVGHVVALGPLYLTLQVASHLPWWLNVTVATVGLAALVIRRRYRRQRVPGADKPPMAILAFIAGSEEWTGRQRWQVSMAYSLWLQKRGIFPLLTLLTAVPSQRLMIALYNREVKAGKSREEALSHVLTLRTARLITALLFYVTLAVATLWPLIW